MSDSDQKALTDALSLLARRDFSTSLLRQRLLRKGHSAAAAASACERCIDLGYVNDHDYGLVRAEDLLRRKPSGRRALLHDLRHQGLAPTMTERVAEEAYARAGGEAEVLGTAVRRWIDRYGEPDEWRAVKRCSDHLARRGFAAAAVQAALSPWLDELTTR